MSNQEVYTGKDTLELDGNLINDGANGKVVEIRYPNNISNTEVGKDGNAVITYISNGVLVEATIRVLVGSKTDQYLSLRKSQFENDPASFVALKGKFTKRVGDGTGQTKKITADLQGGVFMKNVEMEEDTTGDVEQAVAVYPIRFTRGVRTIS